MVLVRKQSYPPSMITSTTTSITPTPTTPAPSLSTQLKTVICTKKTRSPPRHCHHHLCRVRVSTSLPLSLLRSLHLLRLPRLHHPQPPQSHLPPHLTVILELLKMLKRQGMRDCPSCKSGCERRWRELSCWKQICRWNTEKESETKYKMCRL